MTHSNTISITNSQRTFRISVSELATALDSVLQDLGQKGKELSVLLVGDRRMRQLNREFRGVDATTDVLSFSMQEGPGNHQTPMLGDLVLSMATLARQCTQPFDDGRPLTGTPQRELALMSIHGLLHLLGFDHEKGPKKAKLMLTRELDLFDRNWHLFPQPVQPIRRPPSNPSRT